MKDRNQQIDMLLGAARGLCSGDAEAISLLVGTLTIACARASDPLAVLSIVIESLTTAKRIAEARTATVEVVS